MSEYGTLAELYWQGKTEVFGETALPVPLCPPQYSHNQCTYLGMNYDLLSLEYNCITLTSRKCVNEAS
jgi:hypothetical protein